MTERTFDRRVHYDERSRAFPIRALVAEKPLRGYTWSCPVRLDQGREGACVGFAWGHELASRPKTHELVGNADARNIYLRGQHLDVWEDTPPQEGTSVLAGAKASQEFAYLGEYRWCFSVNDLALAVGYAGPVVMGTWWWTGMIDTDFGGYVHATGSREGGHAWLVNGYSVRYRRFTCLNSWGTGWGLGGVFYVGWDDMETLLHDEGEGCVPTTRMFVSQFRI